jgi:hypothetical protein
MATGGNAYDSIVSDIPPDQASRVIRELRDQFSYVIIDCTSYKEAVFTGMGLVEADQVVVCIPHRVSAAFWHLANGEMLNAIVNKTVYVDADTRKDGCDMEQILRSIGSPDHCNIKLNYVDSAYYCENNDAIIVLQGGKQEKTYKNRIMELIKALISIGNEDRTDIKNAREKRKSKNKGPELVHSRQTTQETEASDEADDNEDYSSSYGEKPYKPHFGKVATREENGRAAKKVSAKEQRRLEEEAIRKAQEEYYKNSMGR